MSQPVQGSLEPSERTNRDLLAATRDAIEERIRELRPLVAEVPRLEQALAALQGIEGEAQPERPPPPAARRRRGRPPGRRSKGTRTDQFLALVRDRPGVTIGEAAEAIGAAPTYLYRIAATLEREGTVRREGRGYVAPGSGPAAPERPGEDGPAPTGTPISLPESGASSP